MFFFFFCFPIIAGKEKVGRVEWHETIETKILRYIWLLTVCSLAPTVILPAVTQRFSVCFLNVKCLLILAGGEQECSEANEDSAEEASPDREGESPLAE